MKRFVTNRKGEFYVIHKFFNDQNDCIELEHDTGKREILPMYRAVKLVPREKLEILRIEFNQEPV